MENELDTRYNNILISGRKDGTLTYSKYVKDKSSGRGLDEIVDSKVSKSDQLATDQLADGSVTNEKIAQGAVGSRQIEYDAIRSEHIDYGAVGTEELHDDCVQTEKILDHAVTMEKLADGSVVNKKLAPDSVSATKIADQAVLVSKIADEVWEKLKNEYLRLDGRNAMNSDLDLNQHDVININELSSGISGLGDKIILGGEVYSVCFKEVDADSDEPSIFFLGGLNKGEADFRDSNFTAKSYKTTDRSNIGLLVNDGSVGLAMTDSDIDSITSQVFTNYVNND